jgi:hypothetical protein
VKKIRKRVTYANVMSSIAVFLVLGGASAYAAKKIGSNEIKGNSITTGKLKKNAVTASKIKKSSITTAKIANDAVTGEKVKESTLGEVPSAAKATTATSAGTATIGLSPVAYARVAADGKVIAADSRGITQSNVSLQSTSAYCFAGLTFPFKTAMAVIDYGDETSGFSDNPTVSVALGDPYGDCSNGAQLEVAGSEEAGFSEEGFFIWFYN